MVKYLSKSKFYNFFPIVLILFSIALLTGCGGGGGSSSSSSSDIGPIVCVIEGYVYVPSGTTSPAYKTSDNKAGEQTGPLESQEITITASSPGANKAAGAVSITPTSGYVPLSSATIQLSGTNKATVTTPAGYYKFEIGQKEATAFGAKKLLIYKPEANVSVEFEVAIISGENRYVHTEINTNTGEKVVKEILTNKVQSPFIYASGRVISATGLAINNAAVKAVKVSNPQITKTVYTDSQGVYQFTEMTDGLYTLTITKENYKTVSKNIEASSSYTISNIDFIVPGTFNFTPRVITAEISSVKIVYATSVPTSYTIEYGLSTTYLYNQTSGLYNITNEINLSNLSPKTVYHYIIRSIDQYGNSLTTDDATFETLDPNSNSKEAPIINSNYTVRKTHNSITVSFNTNTSAYAQIEYALPTSATYSKYPADGSETGPMTNFEITVPNLTNSTTYKVFMIAKNMANKSVYRREPQLPMQITTDNSPDIIPPTISNLLIKEIKAKETTITFDSIDTHEGIRNSTDAKVYYGLSSYPSLQFDYSVTPPKPRLDYYQKISDASIFSFDTQKSIKLTGLEPSKKYYFRPASLDPTGNLGTLTDEVSFTTAAPGTTLAFALSESPDTNQISVGENAKILRMILSGSTEENLTIQKMVFKQTGTISYNAVDKLSISDGVNIWAVNNPVSSNIEVNFTTPALIIPKNNSIYLTVNMTLNTSALNPGGSPRNIKLTLSPNSASETNVAVTGDIYGDYIKDQVKGLAVESNPQTINIGQLKLSSPDETQNSTETKLVNKGQKDVTLFKFKLEALYEDINITKLQLSQIGSAISETDYSNIRLYDGINSLAVGASSGSDILFQSITGLLKVPKGSLNTKTLSVVADIQPGANDAKYMKMQIDKANVTGEGNHSKQNVEIIGIGTPITGSQHTIGDSSLLASLTTDSPTKQTFKLGDTNKVFTTVQLTAGSAEDVRIDTIELTFQGTATFTSAAFSIIDENGTVFFTKSIGGGGLSSDASYNATTKKLTAVPQNTLIVRQSSSKKLYIKGNISATSFEVGKTIQINIANEGDVKGTGVQTNSTKAALGTAIGSEHSVIGSITMVAVLPQPSNILLPGSAENPFLKFKITPNGEAVDVQSFNFAFSGSYSVLDKLKVIDPLTLDITTGKSKEVALNPSVSGTTITLTPQAAANITTAGATYWLVGDILNTATSNDTIKFSINADGITVRGNSSSQVYKTIEPIPGNNLSISAEAFYLVSDSTTIPDKLLIGSNTTQEVYTFKLEAKPRTGYYLQKITLRQLGTATFGTGQDIEASDFEFRVENTYVNALVTISGSNLTLEFPLSTDARIDATSSSSASKYLNCKLMCKARQSAINNKTIKLYLDNTLTIAKSITSNNQISGSGSITGQIVTIKEGILTAKSRGDNPGAANIINANEFAIFSFDLTSEIEALDIRSMDLTLDVKNGLITDFNPSSMVVRAYNNATNALISTYQGGNITASGNKFTITPFNSTYLQVPANNSVKIAVSGKADFANAQSGSQISMRLASNSDIMAVGATSNHKIYSNGIINGNYMTIQKTASAVTISSRSDSPAAQTLTATTAADLFSFDINANNIESVEIRVIKVTLDGLLTDFDQSSIVAKTYDGATLLQTYTAAGGHIANSGSKTFTITIPASSAANSMVIPSNSARKVLISGSRLLGATAGNQFKFKIAADGDISANGLSSGSAISSTGTSNGNLVSINSATAVPSISNVASSAASATSMKITWDTSKFTNSVVNYGTSSGIYTQNSSLADYILNHSITLSNLNTGITYYYVVKSTDANNNSVTSAESTFSLTPIKDGYLEVVAVNPADAIVAAGTRILIGKFDLKNFKDATHGDDVRINSIRFTIGGAATLPITSITKLELTDGNKTYTINSPASSPVTFTQMNYIVPQPTTSGAAATMATLSLYATVNAASSSNNKTLSFNITDNTTINIASQGALYGSTISPTFSATPLNTSVQTFDIGTLLLNNDAVSNLAAATSTTPGSSNVLALGLNFKNERTGAIAESPEDIIVKTIKITNIGTGSLSADMNNLKLYDSSNNLISTGIYKVDSITGAKYYIFGSDAQPINYTIPKGATASYNLKIYANIPSNATLGKTIQLKLVSADITASNFSSLTTPNIPASTLNGTPYTIGTSSLTVTLDSSSPAAANFVPDATERLFSIFNIATGTGEGVSLNSATFVFSGTIAAGSLSNVRLYDGVNYYPLTAAHPNYSSVGPITLNSNSNYKFSIYATVAAGATAGGSGAFTLNTAGLSGSSSVSGAAVSSVNSPAGALSSATMTAVGKLTMANDDSGNALSGNVLIGDTNSGNGVDIFRFKLTPTKENVKINSIKFYLEKGSFTNDIDSALANLKLKYNGTGATFGAGDIIDLTGATKTISGNYITFSGLSGIVPFNELAAGTTYYFGMAGNIKSTSAAGTGILMKIESVSDISANGVTSTKPVSISGSATGNTLTSTSGGLSVSDAKTNDTKEILINSPLNALAAVVKFTAASENLNITEIKINVAGDVIFDSASGDFDGASPYGFELRLSDLTSIAVNPVVKSANTFTFTPVAPIAVTTAAPVTLVISNKTRSSATAGRKAKISIETGFVKATGAVSGKTVTSTGSVNYNSGTDQQLVTGLLNAAVDATSPAAKTILKGKTNETLGIFKLTSDDSPVYSGVLREDITLTDFKITLSAASSNVSNVKIILSGQGGSGFVGTYSPASSSTYDYTFNLAGQNITLVNSAGGYRLVSVVADIASSAAASNINVKMSASGVKGAGVISSKTLSCSSADLTAATHTISTSAFTISQNSTYNPSALDLIASTSTKVMAIDLSADNTENLSVNRAIIKFEGSSITGNKITELIIKDAYGNVILTQANPFASSDTMDVAISPAILLTKATTTFWSVWVKVDPVAAAGSYFKLNIADAPYGLKAAGLTSGAAVYSKNAVSSSSHYFRGKTIAISANAYTAENLSAGNTSKTVLDFKLTAGPYCDVKVTGLRIRADSGNTANLASDLSRVALSYDGVEKRNGDSGFVFSFPSSTAIDISIPLSANVNIAKGSYKSFKILTDIPSSTTNGRTIKLKADSSVGFDLTNDFEPDLLSGNLTGSASGNSHLINVYGSLAIASSTLTPRTSDLTLSPISNGPSGSFLDGTVAVFALSAGPNANVNLTGFKFENIGTSSDLSAVEARLNTSHANLAGGTQFSGAINSATNRLEFSNASGYTINAGATHYIAVYSKIKSGATNGRSVRMHMNTTDSSDTWITASGGAGINYSGDAYANSIYIDSPEVNVQAVADTLADVTFQFPANQNISDKKVMELSVTNSNFADFTIDKIDIEVKQDATSVGLNSIGMMSLALYDGTEKVADAPVTLASGNLTGNFVINNFNTANKIIPKGNAKKYFVKYSSGATIGNYGPKMVFAIKGVYGKHYYGAGTNNVIAGYQISRIPVTSTKYYSYASLTSSSNPLIATLTQDNYSSKIIPLSTNNPVSESIMRFTMKDINTAANSTVIGGSDTKVKITLNGNIPPAAILSLTIKDATNTVISAGGAAVANPFASGVVYEGLLNGEETFTNVSPADSQIWDISVSVNNSLITSDSYFSLSFGDSNVKNGTTYYNLNKLTSNTFFYRKQNIVFTENSYSAANYPYYTTQNKLLDFTITSGDFSMDVKAIHLVADAAGGNTASLLADVSNIKLYDGAATLISTGTVVDASTVNFTAASLFNLPKNTSKNLYVVADIAAGATLSKIIKTRLNYSTPQDNAVDCTIPVGTYTAQTNVVSITGSAAGNSHTVAKPVIAFSDNALPSSSLLLGATNNKVFSFAIKADDKCALTVKKIAIKEVAGIDTISYDEAATDITNIRLYDGATLIATAADAGRDATSIAFTGLTISIPKSTTKILDVVADIPSNATAGGVLKMQTASADYAANTDFELNSTAPAAANVTITGNPQGNAYTIATPAVIITASNPNTESSGNFPIYSSVNTIDFTITGNSNYDMGVYTIPLLATGSNTAAFNTDITAANVALVVDGVSHFNGGNYAITTPGAGTINIALNATSNIPIPKNTSKSVQILFNIPAGTSGKVVQLKPNFAAANFTVNGTAMSSMSITNTATSSAHNITNPTVTFSANSYPTGNYTRYTSSNKMLDFSIAADAKCDVTVEKLYFVRDASSNADFSSELSSIKLYDENNVELATAAGVTASAFNFNTLTLAIPKGSSKTYYIKANVADGSVSGHIIKMNVDTASFVAADFIINTVDPPAAAPAISGSASGNTHTILSPAMSLSASSPSLETAGNYTHGTTGKIPIDLTFTADSYCDLNIKKIIISAATGNTANYTADISNIRLVVDGVEHATGGDYTITPAAASITIALTNTAIISVGKGSAKSVQIKTDIAAGATVGNIIKMTSAASGYTANTDFTLNGSTPADNSKIDFTGSASSGSGHTIN